jgi:hypothetical protein
MGKRIQVSETRRTIHFDNGERLDLHNVTAFDCSAPWLRLWCDEGFVLLNPSRVLCHIVKDETRQDEAQAPQAKV